MRPFKAHDLARRGARRSSTRAIAPIDAHRACAARSAPAAACSRDDVVVDRRRAAVRARGHGRLRRSRAGHRRREPRHAANAALHRAGLHRPDAACRRSAPGECIEIATGAPMPAGADAVVMVEETRRRAASSVRVFAPVNRAQNIGRQGADIQTGPDGPARRDAAQRRAASARSPRSASTDVEVYAQPRVAILSTGNEIVEPGAAAGARARSTTSTASRSPRSSPSTAACRCPTAPPPTRSRICRARSTSASSRTCWCSRAAARSASAT